MSRKHLQTNIPGFGFIYHPSYRTKSGELKHSAVWWMAYNTLDGRVAKSTRQRDQAAAFAELTRQAGRQASGEMDTAAPEQIRFNALFDLLERDYTRGNRSTLGDMKARVAKHLRPAFGAMRVQKLRRRDIEDFVDRARQIMAPATVNKLLAYLRHAMYLGLKEDPPLVLRVPRWFQKLDEDNVRTGLVTESMYRALLAQLPTHAQIALVIGYHVGMRIGEILSLRWDQIDWNAGVIRLDRRQTKSKKTRLAPIYGDMRTWLEMARAVAQGPHIVQIGGERVLSIKTTWHGACARAKLGKVLIHDLRRTAATNMDAAGISREQIKACVGWDTDAMFTRYNIGTDRRAVDMGRQMEAWQAQQRAQSPQKVRAN